MKLPSHLKQSRHGIYYFRITVPAKLKAHYKQSEIQFSLHTRDPKKAKRLGYTLTTHFYARFDQMSGINSIDPNLPLRVSDELKNYELEVLPNGGMRIKSDGAEDRQRAMEALQAASGSSIAI